MRIDVHRHGVSRWFRSEAVRSAGFEIRSSADQTRRGDRFARRRWLCVRRGGCLHLVASQSFVAYGTKHPRRTKKGVALNTPLNQKPSDLSREQLPEWALRALDEARHAAAAGEGFRPRGDLTSWYVPERGLGLWSRPSGRGLLLVATGALLLAGFGLLVWALLALRTDRVLTPLWVSGGLLAFFGAVGVSVVWKWLAEPKLDGLLVSPHGLLVKDGARYRIAARAEIHELVCQGGQLTVVYGPERRSWRQYSARAGTAAAGIIEQRGRALTQWHTSGVLPPPQGPRDPQRAPRPTHKLALTILAIVTALLGFLWLTLVMPARSDAGRIARAFVAHVRAGEYDAAYALLSTERKRSLGRDQFEATLPPKLRSASGFTVNSMSTGVGTVVGSETCIDGWLDDVSGYSGYAFDMIVESDALRIETYREGTCRKR